MRIPRMAATIAAALLAAGCGTAVYRPPGAGQFELDPATEINDEDVKKAFEARPQLQQSYSVAYYSFDPARAEALEGMVRSLPGVRSVYRIPPLLVTGERRYAEHSPWEPAKPVSVKKLRLIAARAHADVLMIFDHGHKVDRPPNGLIVFAIALVPMLFVPMSNLEVESYLEAFVIDTRNGYLYGHLTTDEKGGDSFLMLYSDRHNELIEEQWGELLKGTGARLRGLLEEERKPREAAAAPARTGAEGAGAEGAGPAPAPPPLPSPPPSP